MNNLRNIVKLTIITAFFASCNASKESQELVIIKQIESEFPIKIRADRSKNVIFRISFPLEFVYEIYIDLPVQY
jgi:hypothetical protein